MKRIYPFVAGGLTAAILIIYALSGRSSTVPANRGATQVTQTQTDTPSSTVRATPPKPLADGTRTSTEQDVSRYGYLQLKATVSGGKLTQIDVLESPNEHNRSVQINQYALPQLKSEALTAQSASVDIVSGATATSMAFTQALQSALGG